MKDLLIYVADADAEAFLRSVLVKHQALGIRAVTFDIMRHPQRDAGMVQTGAELARMQKVNTRSCSCCGIFTVRGVNAGSRQWNWKLKLVTSWTPSHGAAITPFPSWCRNLSSGYGIASPHLRHTAACPSLNFKPGSWMSLPRAEEQSKAGSRSLLRSCLSN